MATDSAFVDDLSAAGYVQRTRGTLIATVPHGDDGFAIDTLIHEVLEQLKQGDVHHIVLDASRISLIDLHDFDRLRQLFAMARAMGAHCMMSGVQPAVAATLVLLDAEVDDIEAYCSLDAALDSLS